MAISLPPMASLSLLTGANCTSGRRFSLNLPMAAASFSFPSSSFSGFMITKVRQQLMVLRASVETDGNDASGSELPPLEGSDKPVSVESLPLESKQQMLLEQKLRMKLAKKIRLRRKRLVRKRRMRKKGRWPPSKMKKNKNV